MISLNSKAFIVSRIDGWAVVGSMHSGFKKNSFHYWIARIESFYLLRADSLFFSTMDSDSACDRCDV
jgi:hypothetical protein